MPFNKIFGLGKPTGKKKSVAIIGTGNVAWQLSEALEAAGNPVQVVYGRDLAKAEELAERTYDGEPTDDPDISAYGFDVALMCISDQAIPAVAQEILLPENAILAHTAGSVPLSALGGGENTGVFYPLQTISKGKKIDFRRSPFCIEGQHEDTTDALVELAQTLSKEVYEVDTKERAVLHLSATIACNFTNHLLATAYELLQGQGLELDMLKPLIEETIHKALSGENPDTNQTGPARRGDLETILKHNNLLQEIGEGRKAELYNLITRSIAYTNLPSNGHKDIDHE